MPPHDELQCPYCGSHTEDAWSDIHDQPAETFDQHFIGIKCSDCNEYYELAYEPTHRLFWEADDAKSTEYTVPPADREDKSK